MSDGIFHFGTQNRSYVNWMPVARRLNSNKISICLFKALTSWQIAYEISVLCIQFSIFLLYFFYSLRTSTFRRVAVVCRAVGAMIGQLSPPLFEYAFARVCDWIFSGHFLCVDTFKIQKRTYLEIFFSIKTLKRV